MQSNLFCSRKILKWKKNEDKGKAGVHLLCPFYCDLSALFETYYAFTWMHFFNLSTSD